MTKIPNGSVIIGCIRVTVPGVMIAENHHVPDSMVAHLFWTLKFGILDLFVIPIFMGTSLVLVIWNLRTSKDLVNAVFSYHG